MLWNILLRFVCMCGGDEWTMKRDKWSTILIINIYIYSYNLYDKSNNKLFIILLIYI